MDALIVGWTPRLLSVLRIVAAFLFMAHGTQKWLAFPVPRPTPTVLWSLSGVAGVLELVGGTLLLLGLFTRPVAFVLVRPDGVCVLHCARAGGFLADRQSRRAGGAVLLRIPLPGGSGQRSVEHGRVVAEGVMAAVRLVAITLLVVLAGCATIAPPAPTPPTQPAAQTISPSPSPTAAPPVAKAPAKSPAPPRATAKQENIAPAVAKPTTPPLNLATLEERLKGTNAIGVLTKITLKNQVDDLLDDFRAYYKGKLNTTLADLRRSFEMLVLKVLSLLQDSDPSLAAAIAASRDAIWGILSDPAKFAKI